jgi:CheY-like chemotaxis protein
MQEWSNASTQFFGPGRRSGRGCGEFLRELRQRPAFVDVPVIVVTAKELTAEDVRMLSGQTERIIAKDQAYLATLAAAVRERLARQPSGKTQPVAA